MSDKISGYINGEFDYESGSLIFSCSKIEINMKQGEILEDSLRIEEEAGKEWCGKIYSTNTMFVCLEEELEGRFLDVPYRVDATGKLPGDVFKGELHIISDMGEYSVPFVINIIHENMESSLGSIKNLFHFTNLAKSNWEEAVKLFYDKHFPSVLAGSDGRYFSLYKGLMAGANPNRNLEEFLIGIHKKKQVEFELDKQTIKLVNPDVRVAHIIRINRVGWGYLQLYAEAEGDFIHLDRGILTDDDFLGNSCEYHFYIDKTALHEGNNYGCIRFHHSYGVLEAEVQVTCHPDGKGVQSSHREKKITYSLTRSYMDFRMKRLSASKWIAQTKELLEHYGNLEAAEAVDCSLFEAHLQITQEHFNEAKWILDHSIGEPEQLDDTRYCYYLYLTSLYNGNDYYARQIGDQVMSIYRKNENDWRIAWLLLYLHGDVNKTVGGKWNFAIKQIENGCHSPVFYLETLLLLNSEPSLLVHLEDAQLRLLQFGAREKYLCPELMQQITYIASRAKNYDKRLVSILKMIYEKKPQEETLRVICTLLMKGDCYDPESFIWYEKGVEQNLSITRLYEYYMMSMDIGREQEIQKKALMYFSYQCALPGKYAAYLYCYIVKHKDKLDELYELYRPQIQQFLEKRLYAGKVNNNLAYLYQEVVIKEMNTPDNMGQLSKLIFTNRITVEDKRVVRVIVRDDRLSKEMVYPVTNGQALVQIFSNEHAILLEDREGNRYFGTLEYQTECFFLPRKFLNLLNAHVPDSLSYNLYLCGDSRDSFSVTAKNAERCRYLLTVKEIDEQFGRQLRMSLMHYYFEQDKTAHLEEMLLELKPEDVLFQNRGEVVNYLTVYGLYEKAYDFTVLFGAENVDAKTIVRFCSGLLERGEQQDRAQMTCMLYSAFERGKYNELGLEFLMQNYKGPSKCLRNIWKAAVSFDMEVCYICERLLVQTLETGAFVAEEGEIYKNFAAGCVREDLNRAYLTYKCYEQLVLERIVAKEVFDGVERLYRSKEEIPEVCMLAYLQFYSKKVAQLSEKQAKMCEEFLRILHGEKKITLRFFTEYKNISVDARRIADSALIEYKGDPKSRVVVHYSISRDGEENCDFIKEEMKNMFAGIFVKEFVLFYGETLQYYVTEAYANREQLTESGTIQLNETLLESFGDRYSMVNDIAIATTLEDYSTARELLEEYTKKEFVSETIFGLQ